MQEKIWIKCYVTLEGEKICNCDLKSSYKKERIDNFDFTKLKINREEHHEQSREK